MFCASHRIPPRCIKAALDETHSIKSRRKHISTLLRAELSEPLSRQLNERVDCSIIPEKWEGKILKLVSNKVGSVRRRVPTSFEASTFFLLLLPLVVCVRMYVE